jgi:hypothetical protein
LSGRQAGKRFLAQIARAARERGDAESLNLADEALPMDNEALEQTEGSGDGLPQWYAWLKGELAACRGDSP